jgi:hypothetical protein
MKRRLTPEILDSLPPDDPAARHSRRDLRVFNAVLGGEAWCRRRVPALVRPGERVIELGAGTGEFGISLARKLPSLDGLDRCPRPPGWPAESRWHQVDAFAFEGWRDYRVVIGSLIFHHFDAEALHTLGRRLADHARLIVACEPARRRRFQWLFAALCRLIGAHPVSRHDGWVSIEAGFLGQELPEALGLETRDWRCDVTASTRGSYRLVAERRE